ncbi:histone deacetylase complex subunit SAP25 isoform X2 [Protopterus annectens]|uniref:histone deacetylase complex subunit SAP25 isoform X2 n=1 Tax=Protopterus annectens TaxID=7888 RepID=UPI001CFB0CE1|nr:histone deacetylase complex subunit SAP25 isoform X2 [Protopterus annectens]
MNISCKVHTVTHSEHLREGIFSDDEALEALLDSIVWEEKHVEVESTSSCLTEEEIKDESVSSDTENSEWFHTRTLSESPQTWLAPFSPPALPYCGQSEEDVYLDSSDIDLEDRDWGPSYTHAACSSDTEYLTSERLLQVGYSSAVGAFCTRTVSHPSFYPYYTALSAPRSPSSTEQEVTRRTQAVPVISHHDFYYVDPLLPAGHRVCNHLSQNYYKVFGGFHLNTPQPIMSVCESDSLFSIQDACLPSSKDCNSLHLQKRSYPEVNDTAKGSVWWANLSLSECEAVIALFHLQEQDQACTKLVPEITVAVSGIENQSSWHNNVSFKSADALITDALVWDQAVYRQGTNQAVMNEGEQLVTDMLLGEPNEITATDISMCPTESNSRSANNAEIHSWHCMEELEAMCGLLKLCAQNMHCQEAWKQDLTSKSGNLSTEVPLLTDTESMSSICKQAQEDGEELRSSELSPSTSGTSALQQPGDCDKRPSPSVLASLENTDFAQEPFIKRVELSHFCSFNEVIAIAALLELHFLNNGAEGSMFQNMQCRGLKVMRKQ